MSHWHREWHRKRARARILAMGGPWPCAHCGKGEVWKAYAKYCGADCRKAANVAGAKRRYYAKKNPLPERGNPLATPSDSCRFPSENAGNP